MVILKVLFSCLVINFSYANEFRHKSAITEAERQQATEQFVAILRDTRYFNFVESRVHGVPQDNIRGAFWQSSFWTGVKVAKTNGLVTYTHRNNGSDNIGIHTAPYLEGACYAYRMTGHPRYAKLARKLIRGFSSWILSSALSTADVPRVLNRSFYPESFTSNEDGRKLVVNFEASRPGVNSDASEYVHVPGNSYFGDIWVKNNRSVDDIGHMMRSMAQIQVCRDLLDLETRTDFDQMNALYSDWAKSVVATGFIIPTLNANGQIEIRKNGIGDYNKYDYLGFNPNCNAKLALHFMGSRDSGSVNCRSGMSSSELNLYPRFSSDVVEILRAHHISAILWSELNSRQDLALNLRKGFATRLQKDFDLAKSQNANKDFDVQDVATEFVHAANIGAPLTADQIRFLYERLQMAYNGLRAPEYFNTFHLFEPSVPDGEYSYDAPNIGLYFYTYAAMLGSCSSKWSQRQSSPLFDCSKIKEFLLQ